MSLFFFFFLTSQGCEGKTLTFLYAVVWLQQLRLCEASSHGHNSVKCGAGQLQALLAKAQCTFRTAQRGERPTYPHRTEHIGEIQLHVTSHTLPLLRFLSKKRKEKKVHTLLFWIRSSFKYKEITKKFGSVYLLLKVLSSLWITLYSIRRDVSTGPWGAQSHLVAGMKC